MVVRDRLLPDELYRRCALQEPRPSGTRIRRCASGLRLSRQTANAKAKVSQWHLVVRSLPSAPADLGKDPARRPCSGTGTLARHTKLRGGLQPSDLENCTAASGVVAKK